MAECNDGGQAFPVAGMTDMPNGEFLYPTSGMSLRDYFAARAMHAELLSAGSFIEPAKALVEAAMEAGQTIEQRIAFNAYSVADAMLAERAK